METKAVIKMLEMALMDVQADISVIRTEGVYNHNGIGKICKRRLITKQTNGLWKCEFSSAWKFEDCNHYSLSCFALSPMEIDTIIACIIEYDCDGHCEIEDYKITLE